jgi:hypothetical protein
MSPAAAKALPSLLVYLPNALKKLFMMSFFGILKDLGYPLLRPLPIPSKNPVQNEDPTVKATLSPKSFPEKI